MRQKGGPVHPQKLLNRRGAGLVKPGMDQDATRHGRSLASSLADAIQSVQGRAFVFAVAWAARLGPDGAMIEWTEDGTILAMRRHGESSAIVEVFTQDHGRHAGVVRGGASRKMAAHLQPGSHVSATWKARLDEHLGSFLIEPIRSRAPALMMDRVALAGLNAITALLSRCLAERDPHPTLYRTTELLLDLGPDPDLWPLAYLRWELALLDDLGFGLDFKCCAVTGATDDLAYVSPRSGRAVSRAGAGDWADRLLPLPPVLRGEGEVEPVALRQAFETTGYFIAHRLLAETGDRPMPAARNRMVDLICR